MEPLTGLEDQSEPGEPEDIQLQQQARLRQQPLRPLLLVFLGLGLLALWVHTGSPAASHLGSLNEAAVIRDFDFRSCYGDADTRKRDSKEACEAKKDERWNACEGKKTAICHTYALRAYNDCVERAQECSTAMRMECAYRRTTSPDKLSECAPPAQQDFAGGPAVTLKAGKSYRFFSMECGPGRKWCNKAVSAQSTQPAILKYDDFDRHAHMITPLKLESAGKPDEFYIKTMYLCSHKGRVCNHSLAFGDADCPGAKKFSGDYQCNLAAFEAARTTPFKFTRVGGKPGHFSIAASGTHPGWQLSTDEDLYCERKTPKITVEKLEGQYEWRLEPADG